MEIDAILLEDSLTQTFKMFIPFALLGVRSGKKCFSYSPIQVIPCLIPLGLHTAPQRRRSCRLIDQSWVGVDLPHVLWQRRYSSQHPCGELLMVLPASILGDGVSGLP